MVFWECLVFERWSAFHRAGEKEKPFLALILGVTAGIGFFTFQAWPVAACLLTLAVFWETLLHGRRKSSVFLRFFIPQFLLFVLLASQSLPTRAGHYAYAWVNPFGSGLPGLNDIFVLFWGSRLPLNFFAYRPWGGGFLNPALATFFFWGVLEVLRRRKAGVFLAGTAAFLLLVFPGLVTGGSDAHAHRVGLSFPPVRRGLWLCPMAGGASGPLENLGHSRGSRLFGKLGFQPPVRGIPFPLDPSEGQLVRLQIGRALEGLPNPRTPGPSPGTGVRDIRTGA